MGGYGRGIGRLPRRLFVMAAYACYAAVPATSAPANVPLVRDERFEVRRYPAPELAREPVGIGDFNRDGTLDFVFSTDRPYLIAALSTDKRTHRVAFIAMPTMTHYATPLGIVGDFNGDRLLDIAVFDRGTRDPNWPTPRFIGAAPVLMLGNGQGAFTPSKTIGKAVAEGPTDILGGNPGDPRLAIKGGSAGDIDRDGDLDLYLESSGGDNITTHIMVNLGQGRFEIDPYRVTYETLHGFGSDYFRYNSSKFVDMNGDGWLDLVLGQSRTNHITHIRGGSVVIYNDRRGRFPIANRWLLPAPAFYYGYTSATALATDDVNGDRRPDILFVHTRQNDSLGEAPPLPRPLPSFTGIYLQLLISTGNGTFRDESAARLGSQADTFGPQIDDIPRGLDLQDIDGNGKIDIVIRAKWDWPLAKLHDFAGRFTTMDPFYFTNREPWYGERPFLYDIDGDGFIDMAHVDSQPGANGKYDEALPNDDTGIFILQYGRGPAIPMEVGTAGRDTVQGSPLPDFIVGGKGVDVLVGGPGGDRFMFGSTLEFGPGGSGDVIGDLEAGDVVDLSAIDADTRKRGGQAFRWIGARPFSGKAGELRATRNGSTTTLAGDVDGDGKAEITLMVRGRTPTVSQIAR